MDPDKHIGMFGILGLALSELLHTDGLTPEQRERQRLEYEGEKRALAIERRAASPIAAAAEAKRQRKRDKLLRLKGTV